MAASGGRGAFQSTSPRASGTALYPHASSRYSPPPYGSYGSYEGTGTTTMEPLHKYHAPSVEPSALAPLHKDHAPLHKYHEPSALAPAGSVRQVRYMTCHQPLALGPPIATSPSPWARL